MQRALVIVLYLVLLVGLQAESLVVYPIGKDIPHNNDFSVKVRVPGGQWTDLYEYEVLVDAHKVQKSSMVNFEFDGTVEIAVTSNSQKINTARIRPLSYNIPHKINRNTISFRLTRPTDISVEVNGDIFHNLHIFANAPELNKPVPADTNVGISERRRS